MQEIQELVEKKKLESIIQAEKRHQDFKNRIQQKVIAAAEIEHLRKIDALLQRMEADRQYALKDEQNRYLRKLAKEAKVSEYNLISNLIYIL